MNKEKIEKYINFYREEYNKKLKTLDVVKDADKCNILAGAMVFMDIMLKNIDNGEFDI